MELRHRQGAKQHHPVDGIGQIAQPAADTRQQMVAHQNAAIPIALVLGGLAYQMPEREGLPRADEDAVHPGVGKFDVDSLVLLQHRVNALAPLDEVGAAVRHQTGQRLALPRVRIALMAQEILDMSFDNFFCRAIL